jgi:hypothetical protein
MDKGILMCKKFAVVADAANAKEAAIPLFSCFSFHMLCFCVETESNRFAKHFHLLIP